jgi:hypothetical protein
LLLSLALVPALTAQSYQTSFAGEAFDRSAGPGTIHNGVKVNASDGSDDWPSCHRCIRWRIF